VVYASSSSALATGSALTFDGNGAFKSTGSTDGFISSTFVNTSAGTSAVNRIQIGNNTSDGAGQIVVYGGNHSTLASVMDINNANNADLRFLTNNTERVRLTSSSLYTASGINVGIGLSGPTGRLHIATAGTANDIQMTGSGTAGTYVQMTNTGGIFTAGLDNSTGGVFGGAAYSGNFYMSGAYPMIFWTSGTQRMRLDSSGNLGLGVTPSAWSSGYAPAFENKGGAVFAPNTTQLQLASNAYINSSSQWIRRNAGYATLYNQGGGEISWSLAGTSTAGSVASFTQAMTLDASGNFYVGTTSQLGGSNITFNQPANADMKIGASVSTGTRAAYQVFVNNTVTTVGTENSSGGSLVSGSSAYSTVISNSGAYPLSFGTNNTERARIDSSGNLLVGTTSNTRPARLRIEGGETAHFTGYGNGFGIGLFMTPDASATGGTATAISFQNVSAATVGTIATTAGATAYNTSSDYRLKNTIAPMTGALAKVALLKPVTYKWNVDGSSGEGFIAHELAEVVPHAVTGEKDAVDTDGNIKPQGIDTSFLVATLTAAIQEQQAIIESLKARLDAANL
jgi:hypothetical protein